MSPSEPLLIDKEDDGIVVVTLNRPDKFNAANEELHGAVASVWAEIQGMPDARAVILTGSGKSFCAGGDLTLLDRMVKNTELRAKIMEEARVIVRSMVEFPLPIVAAVHGAAVGLGCSLGGLSDLVVMEEGAFFADPHVPLGLVAGDGGALTWPLTIGLHRTKEWLLLGGRIDAQQALQCGLANRVVPAGEGLSEARKLAQRLAALPQQALRETRRVLNQPLIARVDEALDDLLAAESRSYDEEAFQSNLARALARSHK